MRKLRLLSLISIIAFTALSAYTTRAQCGCGDTTVSGRVVRSDGVTGIRSARVTLISQAGDQHSSLSNSFGYYNVEVPVGESYVVLTTARGYSFDATLVFVMGEVDDYDRIAQ